MNWRWWSPFHEIYFCGPVPQFEGPAHVLIYCPKYRKEIYICKISISVGMSSGLGAEEVGHGHVTSSSFLHPFYSKTQRQKGLNVSDGFHLNSNMLLQSTYQ